MFEHVCLRLKLKSIPVFLNKMRINLKASLNSKSLQESPSSSFNCCYLDIEYNEGTTVIGDLMTVWSLLSL